MTLWEILSGFPCVALFQSRRENKKEETLCPVTPTGLDFLLGGLAELFPTPAVPGRHSLKSILPLWAQKALIAPFWHRKRRKSLCTGVGMSVRAAIKKAAWAPSPYKNGTAVWSSYSTSVTICSFFFLPAGKDHQEPKNDQGPKPTGRIRKKKGDFPSARLMFSSKPRERLHHSTFIKRDWEETGHCQALTVLERWLAIVLSNFISFWQALMSKPRILIEVLCMPLYAYEHTQHKTHISGPHDSEDIKALRRMVA